MEAQQAVPTGCPDEEILTDAAAVGNATGRLLNWRSLVPHPEWAKARAVGLGVGNRPSGWNAWVTFSIADGANQHGDADATDRNEIAAA
jgi:hypothetical protein